MFNIYQHFHKNYNESHAMVYDPISQTDCMKHLERGISLWQPNELHVEINDTQTLITEIMKSV
jgi:hypothetical protein